MPELNLKRESPLPKSAPAIGSERAAKPIVEHKWFQLPIKRDAYPQEKTLVLNLLKSRFTVEVLKAMCDYPTTTEQFAMLQTQYSMYIDNKNHESHLKSDKFITFLKNCGVIEQIKKKETPFKDKSRKSTYYKGHYFQTSERGKLLIQKMQEAQQQNNRQGTF